MDTHKRADPNPAYLQPRPEILNLIPPHAKRVLDVGCSTGHLAKILKEERGGEVNVVGIEVDAALAEQASQHVDKLIKEDMDTFCWERHFPADAFDCIVFADVLEHLRDPWSVVQRCRDYLAEDGVVVASIPNIRHWSTIYCLLRIGIWPYCESGIHDKTHLRFFTFKNMAHLFEDAGFRIERRTRNFGDFDDKPSRIRLGIPKFRRLERLIRRSRISFLVNWITVQYLIVAKKNHANS